MNTARPPAPQPNPPPKSLADWAPQTPDAESSPPAAHGPSAAAAKPGDGCAGRRGWRGRGSSVQSVAKGGGPRAEGPKAGLYLRPGAIGSAIVGTRAAWAPQRQAPGNDSGKFEMVAEPRIRNSAEMPGRCGRGLIHMSVRPISSLRPRASRPYRSRNREQTPVLRGRPVPPPKSEKKTQLRVQLGLRIGGGGGS